MPIQFPSMKTVLNQLKLKRFSSIKKNIIKEKNKKSRKKWNWIFFLIIHQQGNIENWITAGSKNIKFLFFRFFVKIYKNCIGYLVHLLFIYNKKKNTLKHVYESLFKKKLFFPVKQKGKCMKTWWRWYTNV